MSVTVNGVKFNQKPKKGLIILMILGLVEFVFTVLLFVSLSANTLFPEKTRATAGISDILSYQGRLTDAAGDPVADGTYYFCFSIWDVSTGGTRNPNQLWPLSYAVPTQMSTTVTSGIFNLGIGSGTDDLSTFNFYNNDTVYLNVEVSGTSGTCGGSPFETLNPRQQIAATGYSRATRDVYGSLLRTLNADNRVQLGDTGADPVRLLLGVKNTSDTLGAACSPEGIMWYNSNNHRALVCAGEAAGQQGLGMIVGIQKAGEGSAISSGTANFSAVTNLTISQDGQILKFSGPEAGGGGASISYFDNMVGASNTSVLATYNLAIGANSNSVFLFPLDARNAFDGNITCSTWMFNVSFSGSTATLATQHSTTLDIGIYTINTANPAEIVLVNSVRSAWNLPTATNNSTFYNGNRWFTINSSQWSSQPVFTDGGRYVIGLRFNTNSRSAQTFAFYGQYGGQTMARSGTMGVSQPATNSTQGMFVYAGIYNTTTAAFPATINLTDINKQKNASVFFNPEIVMNNLTAAF